MIYDMDFLFEKCEQHIDNELNSFEGYFDSLEDNSHDRSNFI